MNKRILLGVDPDLSAPTQHALCTVGEFIEQAAPNVHLILLNVIPLTQVVTMHPGMYVGQVLPLAATTTQQAQAEEVLRKARILLQQQGIALEHIEGVVRTGVPADEIIKVAREYHVNFIVVGTRGNTFRERMRRFFIGSVSRRILQFAPCPVMIVVAPPIIQDTDLLSWYVDAIRRYLTEEHPDALAVFTPEQAARQFAPPTKNNPGTQEIAAASRALEQLANTGLLCRHQVQGELRYVND
jgi:nucleotide-binding universal stress UspA family protein